MSVVRLTKRDRDRERSVKPKQFPCVVGRLRDDLIEIDHRAAGTSETSPANYSATVTRGPLFFVYYGRAVYGEFTERDFTAAFGGPKRRRPPRRIPRFPIENRRSSEKRKKIRKTFPAPVFLSARGTSKLYIHRTEQNGYGRD